MLVCYGTQRGEQKNELCGQFSPHASCRLATFLASQAYWFMPSKHAARHWFVGPANETHSAHMAAGGMGWVGQALRSGADGAVLLLFIFLFCSRCF